MRASTLFMITAAVLAGLGVVALGKFAGWFAQPEPLPPSETPNIIVLAAAQNIFAGDLIDSRWVGPRALTAAELEEYRKHPEKYLPPTPGATAMRVAKRDIMANELILRDDLTDMAKPEALNRRLLPNMRAVNISVNKDRSVGGLIQPGEWVDVHLTTVIEDAAGGETTVRTAPVATAVRVIAKRNLLWPVFRSLPDDQPVDFTLEMNPYRAALVEFSKNNGYLSLIPISATEQRELEAERDQLMEGVARGHEAIDPDLSEVGFRNVEDRRRVEQLSQGDYAVGQEDLIRIFGLSTPEPPPGDIRVDLFIGTDYRGPALFNQGGRPADRAAESGAERKRRAEFRFSSPDAPPGGGLPRGRN